MNTKVRRNQAPLLPGQKPHSELSEFLGLIFTMILVMVLYYLFLFWLSPGMVILGLLCYGCGNSFQYPHLLSALFTVIFCGVIVYLSSSFGSFLLLYLGFTLVSIFIVLGTRVLARDFFRKITNGLDLLTEPFNDERRQVH